VLKRDCPDSDGRFKVRQVGRWLIQNHTEYVNDYQRSKKNISARYEDRKVTIKNKIKDLVDLNLIEKFGTEPQSKGSGNVDIFRYTEAGYLFSRIIESFNVSKREIANQEIFDLLVGSIFRVDDRSTSTTIFYSKFYQKCKEKARFGDIVDFFRELLIIGIPLPTILSFFDYAMQINSMHASVMNYFLGLVDETVEELDPATAKLVLYDIKLDFERDMQSKARYPKGYEKVRFEARKNDAVAIEAHCQKCDHYVSIAVNYLDYRKLARKAAPNSIGIENSKCPKCSEVGSMTIPSFV
jgi:hypothetical protein